MNLEQDHDELNPEEKARLSALPRERAPASALEDRVVVALKAKGLIRITQSFQVWTLPRLAGAFAAVVVLLALGFGAGKWQSQPPAKSPKQPMFILLLYEAKQARHR
jgi:hypothetical protein